MNKKIGVTAQEAMNNLKNNMNNTDLKVPTEIYTRCVGYFRPVNQFNAGKKEEFKERLPYSMVKALNYIKGE